MSTDPVALQMYKQTVDALCLQELGRLPAWQGDDLVGGIMLQMAITEHMPDGSPTSAESLRDWLHDQPEAVAYREHPIPPPGPIPPPLPPEVPFRGAFCAPDALPGIPYGDGRRVWAPAFGCYAGTPWQDRMLDMCVARRHTWFEYQISGWPYHRDYPELALDPARTVADLTKIRSRGLRTIVAFRDDRGPDLSYLAPVAAATQDVVDLVMGIYEVNGVLQDPDLVLSVLVQSRRLWPRALLAVHFTDLMEGESHGLVNWHQAVDMAGLNALFFQAAGWLHTPEDVAARLADYTRRLGGPQFHNYPTLTHGVVVFELTTSKTYRGELTEAQGVAYTDAVLAVPMAPDGGVMSVPATGFLDGGT